MTTIKIISGVTAGCNATVYRSDKGTFEVYCANRAGAADGVTKRFGRSLARAEEFAVTWIKELDASRGNDPRFGFRRA